MKISNQSINILTNQLLNYSVNLWFRVGLLVVVFIFAYINAISSLIKVWLSRDDYSHGFLIPFIALYFVWIERERLKQIPIQPNIIGGFILMLVAGVIFLLGNIGGVVSIQQISIIIIIPGLVIMLLGIEYLKSLFFTLTYLIFMIPPIMDIFVNRMHWPFQLFSAKFAGLLLKLLGIPVFQNNRFIELPNITLEVANICSGVRYLVSIVALAIPLAYFTQRYFRRQVLLIILAIVVGIIVNVLRIALIGIWAYNGGKVVHGPMHIFQGFFVSVVGYIFLFVIAWVLRKSEVNSATGSNKKAVIRGAVSNLVIDSTSQLNHPIPIKRFERAWLTAVLLLLALGCYLYLYRPISIPLKNPLKDFPTLIEDWKGINVDLKNNTFPFKVKGVDQEILRSYRDSSGHRVVLYVGYFETQSQDKEIIHYTLQSIYDNTEVVRIPTVIGESILVNQALVKDHDSSYLISYWYNLNGRIIADNYKAKFITTLDGLLHRRTNGTIVMIVSDADNLDEVQKAINSNAEFIRKIIPVLGSYLSEHSTS